MDKNELIETIQQTITPNGLKAITAETLANVLLEIVESIENSGSGQVVFYTGVVGYDETEDAMTFTLTPEEQEHNAKMFKIVKDSPVALIVGLDASGTTPEDYPTKASLVCNYMEYIPQETAVLAGWATDIISVESDGVSLWILPDGSLTA